MFMFTVRVGTLTLAMSLMTSTMAQTGEAEVTDIRAEFVAAAAGIEIRSGSDGNSLCTLQPEPILNWTNPERRTNAGGLFLWTLEGRPAAAMGVYPVNQGFDCEFQSLSTWPLNARENGQLIWGPRKAGIEMQPLVGAPAPAATPTARMLQLRRIARTFSGQLLPPDKAPIALRMLATPLYRYPESTGESEFVDGAMFAFVQATDPEVLLVIEAVREGEAEGHWQFGMCRMSMVPTQMMHDSRIVWETTWAVRKDPSLPYFVLNKQAPAVFSPSVPRSSEEAKP